MLSFGQYSCVMRMQRARSRQMRSSIACQLGEAGMVRPFVCDCGGVDARTAVSGCLIYSPHQGKNSNQYLLHKAMIFRKAEPPDF